MLSSSRKLGGADEHLIEGSENAIVGRSSNFRVRMLLKSAVNRDVLSMDFKIDGRPSLLWGIVRKRIIPGRTERLKAVGYRI